MLAPRQRPLQLALTIFSLCLLLIGLHKYHSNGASTEALRSAKSFIPPANATLGFGALVVVSKQDSPRRRALIQAANVTELELNIPHQPHRTSKDFEKFKDEPTSVMGDGSIGAWLAHRTALEWFLESGHETALVMEDDVDFDIRLRSLQAPLAAHATRQLFAPIAPKGDKHFWSDPSTWDLLYLGHCGDYFGPAIEENLGPKHMSPMNLTSIPHQLYHDRSLLERSNLHPFTGKLFDSLGLPYYTRVIHRSRFPLCTFAYAITRASAQRMLEIFTPSKEIPGPAALSPKAFDIAILHACSYGFSTTLDAKPNPKGLRCYTVNPELFHHMPGASIIADEEEKTGKKVGVPPVDRAGKKQVGERGETSNIGCGFWDGSFSFIEGDYMRLDYLRENVGRQGNCEKSRREQS